MAQQELWVFSENEDLRAQMLSGGKALCTPGTRIASLRLGVDVKSRAHEDIMLGAEIVRIVDHPNLSRITADVFAHVIAEIASRSKPAVILMGATKRGKEIAARLAAKLQTGCVSDCKSLALNEDGNIIGNRVVYAGKAIAHVSVRMEPRIFTVSAGTFEKLACDQSRTGEVIEEKIDVPAPTLNVLELTGKSVTVDLRSSRVIVSAGRGFASKEDLRLVEDLARVLGGEVGCSRPLSDVGWLPEEHHVGLSGVSVKPQLYIAAGISGQMQHITGIKDSKIIVAINNDEGAPIFQVADYGIVGNLYQILPELVRVAKQALGK